MPSSNSDGEKLIFYCHIANFLTVTSSLDTNHCHSITESGKSGFFKELQQLSVNN